METDDLCEDFYESAIRHWIGGCMLEDEEEYDSAVCMQGFAAECALKKLMEKMLMKIAETMSVDSTPKSYSHFGETLFKDITMLLLGGNGGVDVIDPASALRLANLHLPTVLFQDHPDRRYFKDDIYSETDARDCRNAAEHLIREMVRMRFDGYL